DIFSNSRCSRVSWRAENTLRISRLAELPCQCVFSPAAADDQNFHCESPTVGNARYAVQTQQRRLPKHKYHSDRDSVGKIVSSNFSVCRMTVSFAVIPICSPTKILCR